MSLSILSPSQKYAAGALFGLALHQAQIHQTHPLGSLSGNEMPADRLSSGSSSDSVSDDPELWVHESCGLLRPIFKFLEIDSSAWIGLEETAGYSPAKHHVGAFLRLLSEESGDTFAEVREKEIALAKGVDAMVSGMEKSSIHNESMKEKHREYENECREKFCINKKQSRANEENLQSVDKEFSAVGLQSKFEEANQNLENKQEMCHKQLMIDQSPNTGEKILNAKPLEEETVLNYSRKVTVLYELLSGCLASIPQDEKKSIKRRKGYDSRHRVALRLLATWLNVEWIKMEVIETMIACTAMALLKDDESKEDTKTIKSSWAKWKRGGIIGAAALTGGTLMAITGGLAAPAIAAGFGALAPTLGSLIPLVGVSGLAAAASAAGSVAGSVAVAASFGAAGAGLTGSKMARRIGEVDEFEFLGIGENHNQGRLAVEIFVSGFVFEIDDFIKPWEGESNLERYTLRWESKHLIAVSTAIQDWLTSRIALALMKQGAMMTVLSTLLTALAWPATLLTITDLIDSKWTIAVNRSDKAGKLLAEVLLDGLQGHRPVTLVGFSLGARVIFKCLQYLAESEHNDGLVERVVLLGAPIAIKDVNWEAARKVVSGRFVNAYSTNDWMLGVAFRASLLSQGLAGIQPVEVQGIQNVNVTHMIEGHSSYLWTSQHILQQLELDTYYPVFNDVVIQDKNS